MSKCWKGLAAGLLVVMVSGVFADSGAGKKDNDKLQGTWLYASMNTGGNKMSAEELKRFSITYKGDHWTIRQDGKVIGRGTQKLDPSKMPHQIDSPITAGEGKGTTMLGIYRFTKDTRFEVCFDPSGKERPTSFEPKEGQFACIIKRARK